jgi:hypothetical protein
VLKEAGVEVLTIRDQQEALTEIENTDCGALLLCYSIDDRTRQHFAKNYRELCPEGRIVAITDAPLQNPAVEAHVEAAEALIEAVKASRPNV